MALVMLAACQRDLHELSPYVTDQFGSRIHAIRDMDGDGIEEFIVGDDSYAFLPQSGPGHLWILSGTTLECLDTIEAPDGRGSVGSLLGTYSGKSNERSADRIVTLRWEPEGPTVRVLDARNGRVVGAFPIEGPRSGCSFASADVDADGSNDVVLGMPGAPSGATVGGTVQIFDGESFEAIATFISDVSGSRFGESVAAFVASNPGETDSLLISETQYVDAFPHKSRARITLCAPRSLQRTEFFASEVEDDCASFRILPARADQDFLVALERVVGSSRDLRSVSTVTRTGEVSSSLDCGTNPDIMTRDSFAVLDDLDCDGRPEILRASLDLQDAGMGRLYLSRSTEAGLSMLPYDMTGLGASIATARDVRTGRIASIAVGACHPDMPCYQGQVVLLEPTGLEIRCFARRTGPGHKGVRVSQPDRHLNSGAKGSS